MNRREEVATALACGLAGDVVRTFGEVRLRVLGTSMVPSILPGDLISVQRAKISEISLGEIVLYSRENRMFVHRVVGCAIGATQGPEEAVLITRGDRLRHNDPPISSEELLGRVISVQSSDRRGDLEIKYPIRFDRSNRALLVRLLQTSDHATHLYLLWTKFWRGLFSGRAECRV